MRINEIITDWIIMPQSIKPLGLVHKPGTGPNNRFGFKNHSNNRANEEESKVDLKLPNGKKMVLQADDDEHKRGLVITSNEDGSYDSYYWYDNPEKPMPIEIKIDGESVSKDAKNIHWEYHPELEEKAPPGREDQVKKLKTKFKDKSAPYAIAWAQHNKHGKPKEDAAGVGIVTKQNATKDVPVGGQYMNVKKLGLSK